VSSVRQTCRTISAGKEEDEIVSYSSNESVNLHENILDGYGTPQSDLIDAEVLDLELDLLDTEKNMGNLSSGKTEELVESAPNTFSEMPVAFSESIAQRVKRDGVNCRNGLGTSEPVNFDPSVDSPGQDKEGGCESLTGDKVVRPELLDFVGDWPLESQGQRQRHQNSRKKTVQNTVLESSVVEYKDNTSSDEEEQSEPDKQNAVEFQKLVDLLQGGRNSPGFYQDPTGNKPSTLHSPSFGGKQGNLNPETVIFPELPDCVLGRMFSECATNPRKNDSNSPSTSTQTADTIEQSSDVSAEKTTPEEVEQEDNVASEEKFRMSPNAQETLCLKVAIDSESSLERRRGLSRRVGKSCKLALTFTNQSPSSPCSQSPVISHLPSDLPPMRETTSLAMVPCASASAQTNPQDFALLWRIDQLKCSEFQTLT